MMAARSDDHPKEYGTPEHDKMLIDFMENSSKYLDVHHPRCHIEIPLPGYPVKYPDIILEENESSDRLYVVSVKPTIPSFGEAVRDLTTYYDRLTDHDIRKGLYEKFEIYFNEEKNVKPIRVIFTKETRFDNQFENQKIMVIHPQNFIDNPHVPPPNWKPLPYDYWDDRESDLELTMYMLIHSNKYQSRTRERYTFESSWEISRYDNLFSLANRCAREDQELGSEYDINQLVQGKDEDARLCQILNNVMWDYYHWLETHDDTYFPIYKRPWAADTKK